MSKSKPTLPRGVELRIDSDGQARYRVRVRRGGQAQTATLPTIAAALAWRAQALAAVDGKAEPPTAPRPVVVQQHASGRVVSVEAAAKRLCRGMLDGTIRNGSGRLYKPSAMREYESSLRVHVLPRIGELPISTLTRGEIQRLTDELAAEQGAATARKCLTAFRVVLRVADRYGELDGPNPCAGVKAPTGEHDERPARVLTFAETDALRSAAERDDTRFGRSFSGPFVALGLDTGLRLGELLALPWGADGLDLEIGIVHVRRSLDRRLDKSGAYPIVSPKSKASVRDVPLPASTAALMRRHRLATGRPADGALVFSGERGRPIPPNGAPREAWRRMLVAAKIAEPLPRFHDLRHTYATQALAAGVGVHAVANLLGHSTAALVLARYGHALPGEVAAAAGALEAWRQEQQAVATGPGLAHGSKT
jgi:integrase